jgi:TolB-like protein
MKLQKFIKAYSIIFILLSYLTVIAQDNTSIAVINLNAEGISKSEASTISARLRTDLFNTDKFVVLERNKMDEILKEQGFQLSECTTNECVVEVGKLIGVEQIVAGNIGKIGEIITISIRLIDVETGALLRTATEDCECAMETVITKSVRNVAQTLAGKKVKTSTYSFTKDENKSAQQKTYTNQEKKKSYYPTGKYYGQIVLKGGSVIEYIDLRYLNSNKFYYTRKLGDVRNTVNVNISDVSKIEFIELTKEEKSMTRALDKKAKIIFQDGSVRENIYINLASWHWRSKYEEGHLGDAISITIKIKSE